MKRNTNLAVSVIAAALALGSQPAMAEDDWDLGSNADS